MTGLRERISDRLRESLRRRSFRAAASAAGAAADPGAQPDDDGAHAAPGRHPGAAPPPHRGRGGAPAGGPALPGDGGYRLEVAAGGRRLALRLDEKPRRPRRWPCADAAFERAVARAAAEVGARALHVEGLAAIPLGSLLELHRPGLALRPLGPRLQPLLPPAAPAGAPAAPLLRLLARPRALRELPGQDWPVGLRFQEERREIAHRVAARRRRRRLPLRVPPRPPPGAVPRPARRTGSG